MLVSNGNKKIGKDTLIMNLRSSHECPAQGQCLMKDVCYAKSNERLRPSVLNYRRRQEELWLNNDAGYFIDNFIKMKKERLRYIRFQESGDFQCQSEVDKLNEIAEALIGKYICYTYTCRADLDYSNRSKNLVMSGTHFMIDNQYCPIKGDSFDLMMKLSPGALICPNDCRACTLCKVAGGYITYQRSH